jgi:hypothetical protein
MVDPRRVDTMVKRKILPLLGTEPRLYSPYSVTITTELSRHLDGDYYYYYYYYYYRDISSRISSLITITSTSRQK